MNRNAYHVEFDREADGRWIAEVRELPGVMVYGATRLEAGRCAIALALRVLADRFEHGEDECGDVVREMFAMIE